MSQIYKTKSLLSPLSLIIHFLLSLDPCQYRGLSTPGVLHWLWVYEFFMTVITFSQTESNNRGTTGSKYGCRFLLRETLKAGAGATQRRKRPKVMTLLFSTLSCLTIVQAWHKNLLTASVHINSVVFIS